MSETTVKKEDEALIVAEQQDGSVMVEGIELPEDESQPTEKPVEAKPEPESKEAQEELPEDGGEDHPDDTEAIRAARRQKRKAKKEYHRQQQAEKDARFQQLQRQNQELMTRLAAVENKTNSVELDRISKAIEDHQVRMQYAKMKIAEATKEQDGVALADAQEAWYEARRAVESLENLKKQATEPKRAPPIAQDQSMQRHVKRWMDKHSWYDPQGQDEDTAIAQVIDKTLTREGWNPSTQEYWDELDKRLQKRLPHRYTEETEEIEEAPVVNKRPRSVVTGSGRENATAGGGKNTFTLTPDQVKAMKDAGMWDDPEVRNRMIKRYAQESRQNRS